MSQPKLTLRPPPHREFVQGYPGIAGSSARPPAHLAGTVEVRLGTKGLKAAWLRIELRKLETLPGGESWGELIGRGPIDVWAASKSEAFKSEDERGWEVLQTADFPFQVVIPEGLPPSAKLEKQAGVAYELVTSLCVRSKKGLLRKETTSSIIQNTHPIWLEKHELHSSWPVYHYPDEHETTMDDIRVKLHRSQTCYGPGDQVDVRIIVASDSVNPVKVKNVSFAIRETITFRGGTRKTFGSKTAASQKTETLASKSKSFGKKVYKGDIHTFDLSCSIPKTHTLMTIQTAKHIEVAYTIRVQVDAGKKPIVIDHLPITLSNFTRSISDKVVDKIGFVPGLSTASVQPEPEAPLSDGAESIYSSGAPTVTRSLSYAPSNAPYAGYSSADLRRRDTVMTQGTTVSGPGMAGRGIPGQVFSWGQYGAAQPFGNASEVPRPAFAGPPSIYEGHELAPEENRALFHSSNRPQSAYILGTGVDPVLFPPNSRPHSGMMSGQGSRQVTPIHEGSETSHGQHFVDDAGRNGPQRQRSLSNPIRVEQHAPHSTAAPHETTIVRPDPIRGPVNSAEAEKERLYERARQQAERNQRRADERRAQFGMHGQGTLSSNYDRDSQTMMSSTGSSQSLNQGRTLSVAPSAAEEKARLFERARAEAERYQASFAHGAQFPAASGGGTSNPAPGPAPIAADDPRRASAQYWIQGGSAGNGATATASGSGSGSGPGSGSGSGAAARAAATAASSGTTTQSQQYESTPPTTSVSGRPAPYPTYISAEEEKRRLYERAKAETEAFQRGELAEGQSHNDSRSSAYLDSDASASGHQAAASSGSAYTTPPGGWPREETVQGSSSTAMAAPNAPPASTPTPGPAPALAPPPLPPSSAISEKEQLRRYYEAQDAVARHQAGEAAGSGSGSGSQAHQQSYQPAASTAGASATPGSRDRYSAGGAVAAGAQPTASQYAPQQQNDSAAPQALQHQSAGRGPDPQPPTSSAQSYLTEAEQQSAREKERLATHFAKKAARAEARAAAAANATHGGSGGVDQAQSIQPAATPHRAGTGNESTLPRLPMAPAADHINGIEHGRTASSSSVGGARRSSSVIGGRPLPRSTSHSPSASFVGSPPPMVPSSSGGAFPLSSGASEKAQLAAYYAAKDAAEQTAAHRQQQQGAGGSYPNGVAGGAGGGGGIPSRDWLPRIETGPSFYPRPQSSVADDSSSIYTEVMHDPEVLAGKKRAPPSIFSATTPASGGGTMYDSPYGSRPSSVVYPLQPGGSGGGSGTTSGAASTANRYKQPPQPIRRDDPDLWRPRYAWLDEEDEEGVEEEGIDGVRNGIAAAAPPPLPPKIPLSPSGSRVL